MMETSRPATAAPPGEITRLLERWSQGDAEAAEKLMPMVYDVLHRLAIGYIHRERSDHTLQATFESLHPHGRGKANGCRACRA